MNRVSMMYRRSTTEKSSYTSPRIAIRLNESQLSRRSEESRHAATVSNQPSQPLRFLLLFRGPRRKSLVKQPILRLLATRAQAHGVGMDLQEDRHPRIDQLKVPLQLQPRSECSDKGGQLGEPIAYPWVQRANLEVRLGWRERLEMLNESIEALRGMTVFQKFGDGGGSRGQTSRRPLGNAGPFGLGTLCQRVEFSTVGGAVVDRLWILAAKKRWKEERGLLGGLGSFFRPITFLKTAVSETSSDKKVS